jgi:hypothetical protein
MMEEKLAMTVDLDASLMRTVMALVFAVTMPRTHLTPS